MNFMIPASFINEHHKRKGTIMTTKISRHDMNSSELQKLLREKRKARRRQQISAFYENMKAQTSDKLIFLFDNDLNIA